jgi:excinuclease ABC subunit C
MSVTSAAQATEAPSSASPRLENIHRDALKRRVREIPEGPGVYRWLDSKGGILYVGKAKNLRRRMRTYLGGNTLKEGFRKRGLFEKMADLSITVTNTELEALVLETHLIRTLKPRYNIHLTKDTHYAFVKLTVSDDFPSVQVVHVKEPDGSLYFGPYSNPYAQRRMVGILRTLFAFRDCRMSLSVSRQESLFPQASGLPVKLPLDIVTKKRDRRLPCLDFHLEKCAGPCTGMITPSVYRQRRTDPVLGFLRGERADVLRLLIERLKAEEIGRKFDRAEELHFVLRYIGQMKERTLFALNGAKDADAFGIALHRRKLHVAILQVRGGNLVNELSVCLERVSDAEAAFGQFLTRYYDDVRDIPEHVYLPRLPEDKDILEAWCSSLKGSSVSVQIPHAGAAQDLLCLAVRNAEQKTKLQIAKRRAKAASRAN